MVRPDKRQAVDDIADEFRSSSGAVLTEYRGLSVQQLKELRRALGENASYAVVKNTLTRLAAEKAGVGGVTEQLVGPTAIAFIKGDVIGTAKSLRDFARLHPPLVIKGGVLDGRPLSTEEISTLADLESREVLLARLAGDMMASLQRAAFLFNAPLSQAARVFGSLQAKRGAGAHAAAAPVDTSPETAEAGPAAAGPADANPETAEADDPSSTVAATAPEPGEPTEPPRDQPADKPTSRKNGDANHGEAHD